MALDASWQDLKARFQQALSAPGNEPAGSWIAIWRLFVGHPWYASELRRLARQALRDRSAPPEWLGDVEHDAMLLLARSLRHARDLHMDRAKAEDHFPGWIATIIRRDCLQAVRRLRALYGRTVPLQDHDMSLDRQKIIEVQIDVSLAIEKLDEPERTVLLLHRKGMTTREIAGRLGLDDGKAYRILRRGMTQLRRYF